MKKIILLAYTGFLVFSSSVVAGKTSAVDALFLEIRQRFNTRRMTPIRYRQLTPQDLDTHSLEEPMDCPPVGVLAQNYNRIISRFTATAQDIRDMGRCLGASELAIQAFAGEYARAQLAASLPAGAARRKNDFSDARQVVGRLQSPFEAKGEGSLAGTPSTNHRTGVQKKDKGTSMYFYPYLSLQGRGGGFGIGFNGAQSLGRSGISDQNGKRSRRSAPKKEETHDGSVLFPDPEDVKDVLDLQIFKNVQKKTLPSGESVELVDLNSKVGAWYLLIVQTRDGSKQTFNLELPGSGERALPKLVLADGGIEMVAKDPSQKQTCALWQRGGVASGLSLSQELTDPVNNAYKPICGGKLFLRTDHYGTDIQGSVSQSLTASPWTRWLYTQFKYFSGLADGAEEGDLLANNGVDQSAARSKGPAAAEIGAHRLISVSDTELAVQLKDTPRKIQYGLWYETQEHPGIYISLLSADSASDRIRRSYPDRVDKTDESDVVYLAAFDMDRFRLAFKTAGDDQNLGWGYSYSSQFSRAGGPDGISSAEPLTANGIIPPDKASKLVSVFKGGYCLQDMFMPDGPLSKVRNGSHWGIVEQGVVFRRPSPGIATIVTYTDGQTEMMTWPEDDSQLLPRVSSLRQNETAIIEGRDAQTGLSIPGRTVGGKEFSTSNWHSGSNNDSRRRAGLCLQTVSGKKYLIYGYFSGAAPSTMARLFQAYACDYAMQLDINIDATAGLPFFPEGGYGAMPGNEYLHNLDKEPAFYVERSSSYNFFYIYKK